MPKKERKKGEFKKSSEAASLDLVIDRRVFFWFFSYIHSAPRLPRERAAGRNVADTHTHTRKHAEYYVQKKKGRTYYNIRTAYPPSVEEDPF